jgi:hypothetical protein
MAPQPPTWRANCRRTTPTCQGQSDSRREFVQGAEHVDKQPSAGAATLLVVPEEGHHCRERDAARTQVHGPLVEVKPLRPACLYCLFVEVTVQGACRGHGYGNKEHKGREALVFVFLARR